MLTRRLLNQQRLTLIVVAVGLVAIGLSWTKVVQTIADAKPSVSSARPSAIVWAGRVFDSQAVLARWLRSHGATYAGWKRRYPAAAAVIEHRPAVTVAAVTARRAVASPAAAPATGHGGLLRALSLGILVAIAVVCGGAAALPTVILARSPRMAAAIVPHRDLLLAGAAALTVGVLVGALLS